MLGVAISSTSSHEGQDLRSSGRRRRVRALITGLLLALCLAVAVPALAFAAPVQFFYVPFPEDDVAADDDRCRDRRCRHDAFEPHNQLHHHHGGG